MMRFDQTLSVLTIIIIIVGGISVFAHSAGGEEIEIEQDEKQEEKVEDVFNEDKSTEGSECLETKDEENCEEDEERIKSTEDAQDLEERQNFDLYTNTDLDDNSSSTRFCNVNEQVDHNPSIDSTSLRGNDDNDHELIIDHYDIVFQANMTALNTSTTFDIYRIETEIDDEEEIYTADQIRENDTEDKDLIGDIEDKITEVFNGTIDEAFPDAEKDFGETTSTNTEEDDSGPIEISTYADIYLVEESLGFDEDNEKLDMSEVIKETLAIGGQICRVVNLTFEPGHSTNYTFRFEKDEPEYLMQLDGDWKQRVSYTKNHSEGEENVTEKEELRIKHHDPEHIKEEKIMVEGVFELQNLEKTDLTLIYSILSVDIEKYQDEFAIPDTVEDLDFVDADYIRTSVKNGLVEWKTITDEMNNSVEEIEEEMPGIFEEVEFSYSDPGRDEGDIVRQYEEKDFQPTITTEDEEIDIDNELTESLMKSGGIVDFKFSEMDEEYHDYSISMNFRTPEFMYLYESETPVSRNGGDNDYNDYEIDVDPKEGFEGRLRSDEDGPIEQSINLNTEVNLGKVSIRTDILNMDYSAIADTNVEGHVEVEVIEAPEDMKESLSEDITLKYATADLIRQVEKRDIFDKQEVLDIAREGKDIDDFEGVNQTIRDALGKEDLEVSTRYQEGTWQLEEDIDAQPIVLLIESEFEIPLKESADMNAFDIYGIDMGELEIPNVEGIDTNFRIIFPSGIRAGVEETDNVEIGETSDSRSYIEVNMAGDSDEQVTINPEIIITSGIFFSGDIYLHGIPLVVLTILIISLILLGVGMKVFPYKDLKRKKLVRNGMEDAMIEENNPDMWLNYIPLEKVEKYDINQDTLVELGLEEELKEKREKAGEEVMGFEEEPEEEVKVEEEMAEEDEEKSEEELTTDEETTERFEDSEQDEDEYLTG